MDYFGLVILNYNATEQTIALINNLNDIEKMVGIVKIIVDNNSDSDNRRKLLEFSIQNNYKVVTEDDFLNSNINNQSSKSNYLILLDNNYGYAKGNNYGMKLSKSLRCKFTVILNNDVIFTEPVLKRLSLNFKNDSNIGVVGPKVVGIDGKSQGPFKKPTFFYNFWYPLFLPLFILLHKINPNMALFKIYKEKYPYSIIGCFLMFDTEIIHKIHYFDESTFLFAEEDIISEKLRNIGYKVMYDEALAITHIHGHSTNKLGRKMKFKHLIQSQAYYFRNYLNYSEVKIFLIVFARKIEFYFTSPIILFIKSFIYNRS